MGRVHALPLSIWCRVAKVQVCAFDKHGVGFCIE